MAAWNVKIFGLFRCYYSLILIVVISFIIRLCLRSNYLDDWDSVQFILGLKNYSIISHQPHPPGYPVYIFLGRITDQFFDNGLKSFTFMSALFGSLALVPTYLLAKEFFGKHVALLSAIILSLAPAEMLFSEVVMSDIVSMFFIATTVYLLYKGLKSSIYLYLGSFILGGAIGVRQTDILLVILLCILCIFKKNIKYFVISISILSISIAIWLIPTIWVTGLGKFIGVQSAQGKAAVEMSTLYSLGGLNLPNLLVTIKTLIFLFVDGWSPAVFIFGLIVVIVIFYKNGDFRKNISDKRLILLLGWLVPYFILFIFAIGLYIPRYLLPVFPPLSIIFGYAISTVLDIAQLQKIKNVLVLLVLLAIIFMGHQAISTAYALHTTEPAPIAAAVFINENLDPNTTIIISSDSFRHLQYYCPNFIVKFNAYSTIYDYLTPNEISNYISENKTILSEGKPILCNVPIPSVFRRNDNIYPKHDYVKLYINKKRIDEIFFILSDDGWYDLENWTNTSIRWMQGSATLIINSDRDRTASLSFKALSFYRPRTLEIYSGESLVARSSVLTSFVNVSAPIRLIKGTNIVRLHTLEGCERPCDKPELNSLDDRCLSIAVQNVTLTEGKSGSIDYLFGFYEQENWSGIQARWTQADATILVNSPEIRNATMNLNAKSFYQNRTLEVYAGDKLAARVVVPTSLFSVNVPVQLAKGANIMRLHVPEGCERPCDKPELNSTDGRCLSVAVENLCVM